MSLLRDVFNASMIHFWCKILFVHREVGKIEFAAAGMTAGDEMCNLYIMYYSDREDDDFRICVDEEISGIGGNIPADSDDRLPPFKENEDEDDNSVSYSNGGGISNKPPGISKKGSKHPGTSKKGYYRRPSRIRTFNGGYPQPPPSNYGYGFPQAYVPQQQPMMPMVPQYPLQQQQGGNSIENILA